MDFFRSGRVFWAPFVAVEELTELEPGTDGWAPGEGLGGPDPKSSPIKLALGLGMVGVGFDCGLGAGAGLESVAFPEGLLDTVCRWVKVVGAARETKGPSFPRRSAEGAEDREVWTALGGTRCLELGSTRRFWTSASG